MGIHAWGQSPFEADTVTSTSPGAVPAVGAANTVLASNGTTSEWDASLDLASLDASSYVAVGAAPAAAGAARFANAALIAFRNQAGGADVTALTVGTDNKVSVGAASTTVRMLGAVLEVGAAATNVATTGEIRGGPAFNIWARNAANNADLRVAGMDGSNNLYLGTSATACNLHGNTNVALTPFQAASSFTFNGTISPTQLAGDVNDYAPTGFSTCDVMRLDGGAANRNITGLAGGAAGRYVIVHNIGTTNTLVLVHASGSSSAANRFDLSGAANLTIAARGSTRLWYDGTSSLWRVA